MTKRRFIEQLPNVLRTEDLKKFFSATVDHVFQPGKAEPISGYIGRTPAYFDASRDFYIDEPTRPRRLRQLEPMMVTASETAISRAIFYDDLVSYIDAQGGFNSPDRLFENDYYSWAPPVNLGMLTAPQNYYWFGDNPSAIPGLLLSAPIMRSDGTGTRDTFELPPTIAGLTTGDEAVAAWVNGEKVAVISRTSTTVKIAPPSAGALVEVYRYGDLKKLIEGKATFDPTPFLNPTVYYRATPDHTVFFRPPTLVDAVPSTRSDMAIFINGVEVPHVGYRFVGDASSPSPVIALRAGYLANSGDLVRFIRNRDQGAGLTALIDGMRVIFNDNERRGAFGFETSNWETLPWDDTKDFSFIVDGVNDSIILIAHSDVLGIDPLYTVMDRRCRDRNPWARANYWIHRSAFAWARAGNFSSRVAKRPIIEFERDLELFNYGRKYVGEVDCVLSGAAIKAVAWDVGEYDRVESGTGEFDEYVELASAIQINGQPSGSVLVDRSRPLIIGNRLLIRIDVPGREDLSYCVVNVVEALNASNEVVMALEPEANVLGDVVNIRYSETESDDGQVEVISYYNDGDAWPVTQKMEDGAAPLFALYDVNGDRLSDPGFYPNSDFAGSRIFGYASNPENRVDSVLGVRLRYDALGQIMFENELTTRSYSYLGGKTSGTKFYRVFGATASADQFKCDWHPIAAPSEMRGDEVPVNLQANPDNEQITFISKNEWLEHFRAIISNQEGFTGDPFGVNNWHTTARDLAAVGENPLKILQHKSPMLKLMLLASDNTFDFMEAARFMEEEYARFRTRFLHAVMRSYMDGDVRDTDDAITIVSTILKQMKANKNAEFAFTLNTFGDPTGKETFFIPPTAAALGIFPATLPVLETDYTFETPMTLLRGHDGSRMPLFSDTVQLVADGTQKTFVLPTDPAGPLTVTIHNVNVTNFTVAGKIVTLTTAPASGVVVEIKTADIRDRAMLALEQAIYQSLHSKFRTDAHRGFELSTWIAGAFRDTGYYGYSRAELDRVLTPMFLRWTQKNGFDYRTNDGYEQSDPFTWNYRSTKDRAGNDVPGNWRGIYSYYFDTDRPHVCPWEMLGFAQKPSWWEAEYGPAPYTSGNTKLWEDLRDGVIAQGPRAGVDARYVRADLLDILPVDDSGDLLDPMAANIIPTPPSFQQATRGWATGDVGPVEHLWRMSPAFPFALAQAAFLLKPARFVEQNWDTVNDDMVNGQWLHIPAGMRVRHGSLVVHGERDENGVRQPLLGIQQWISERMIAKGQEPKLFGDAVRQLDVRMGHKMAGFTTTENLRVIADNFGLVPQEDVNVLLYSSPSVRQEFYSGVIVEWSGTGWRVFGYDALDPSFTIESGDPSSENVIISTSNVPELVILDWRPNVYFKDSVLVDHKGSLYECTRAHTSTASFEMEYWTARPNLRRPEAPRVLKYLVGSGEETSVPYGTEFQSYQEVADFIFGYERRLENRGWIFDNNDENGPNDWSRAINDFLEWASIQWEPGNFIALSPAAVGLKFNTDHGTVYSLEQAFNGAYGIVNRAGLPISRRDTYVSRIDGEVIISTKDDDLFGVRLNVGEIEHVLVFSNTTIFGDVIYKPLFDLRQERLRLNGHRALDWNGRMDAPGYVITEQDGIMPNFDTAAEDIRTAFDIEGAGSKELRDHARHLVGYESRSYLRDLLLSETQQFEFYQGMIQQKGSAGTFGKTLRSQFIEQDRNLRFLEEWAIKSASYGALDASKRYAFDLWQSHIERNPQLIRFAATANNDDTDVHTVSFSDFISGGDRLPQAFPQRDTYAAQPGDLPTAGYARLDEVDYTAFNLDGVANLFFIAASATGHAFSNGERIWVYEGENHEWDVLRSTDLGSSANAITRVERSETGDYYGARIVLENDHGLTDADKGMLIVIDGETRSKTDLFGVHKIFSAGGNWIEIETGIQEGYDWADEADDPENAPVVRALRSMRFASMDDLAGTASWFTPVAGELIYCDDDLEYHSDAAYATTGKRWIVKRRSSVWQTARVQPLKVDSESIIGSAVYETNTKITASRLISEPLKIDRLVVIDPVGGLVPGEAERELSFKLEYDPAGYNRGQSAGGAVWGAEKVGHLWWDLSTVRFINPETDEPVGDERTAVEQRYRVDNWGKTAPGSSVDVYEWTSSLNSPLQYQGEGIVYNANNPNWVETEQFDPELNRLVPVFYFWVKNKRQVSRLAQDRRLDSFTVARIIEDSTSLDMPWIAPCFTDALLVGGVSQHLNDQTVLQIDVRLLKDHGNIHHEWTLLRPQDSRSQPPVEMWSKMIDSLAGADRFKRHVPDPKLNRNASQGIDIRPRQSLFGGSVDARETLRLARESMVGMLNRIFAREDIVRQRVAPVQKLLGLTDVFPTRNESESTVAVLAWSKQDDFEAALPSRHEYDIEVFSRDDRNDLLLSEAFEGARSTGRKMRVLLNGLESTIPFWSVWEYNPATDTSVDDAARMDNADFLFSLAPAYTSKVSSRADRNVGVHTVGDIVFVEADAAADGFWTLWRYDPAHVDAVEGFVLLRAQDYRVSDFIELADWYAEGYSAANPPVVSFNNRLARDVAMGDNPTTNFVRIDDDGAEAPFNGWLWTAYENGQWIAVAREKRTIAIKEELFSRLENPVETTRYAMKDPASADGQPLTRHDIATITSREGALDVRAMLKCLVEDVLNEDETNELFFSLIHFAHSHLDQINWAFKTSFLYIGGYNEALVQSPVQRADNTESLLAYIDEVKPYRVKTRDFARGLAPPIDEGTVRATDFDKPIYFDPEQRRFRRLSVRNPADALILQRGVYADWYANYQKNGYDLMAYTPETWNPIRRLKTTISFDRIDGWRTRPAGTLAADWDAAAKRIDDYYVAGLPGQREKDINALLKLDFKGTVLDGDNLGDPDTTDIDLDGQGGLVEINGDTAAGVPALSINDPATAANRPEELVALGNQDYVAFNVHSIGRPGAPRQTNKFFDVSGVTDATVTLEYLDLAQSNDAVAVFRDGIRADPPVDYVIDQFKREVTVSLTHDDGSRVQRVSFHVFGVGGITRMVEQRFYTFGAGDSQTLYVSPQTTSVKIEASINGEPVAATANWTTGAVTLAETIDIGDDVLLNVRDNTGSAVAPEIRVQVEELPYHASGTWNLSNWEGGRHDAHAVAIVELDGIRLTPPETKYLRVGSGYRWALINNLPETGSDYDVAEFDTSEYDYATTDRLLWNIWIDNVEYEGEVPDVSSGYESPQDVMAGEASTFAYWRGYLICCDEDIITDDVIVVINVGHDYTISREGVLTILNPPTDIGESRVHVTTFTHVPDIGIETWTYKGREDGNYPIYRAAGNDYVWVNVNGKKVICEVDFNMLPGDSPVVTDEWNVFSSIAGNYDLAGYDTDEWDVEPAREPILQFSRGHDPEDDIVITVFKNAAMRLPRTFLAASIVPGKSIMRPIADDANHVSMEGGWEYFNAREGHTGYLTTELASSATSITVTLPDYSLDLYSDPWFVMPQPDAPGVAWINGERIEYSGLTEAVGTVTLTGLARSSRGTTNRNHPAGSKVIAAVSPMEPRNSAL